MDQVVTVIRDHLAVGHHQDFDETFVRDGTASPSPQSTPSDAFADLLIYKRKRTERNKQDDKASLTHNHSSTQQQRYYKTNEPSVSTLRTKRLITSCWFLLVSLAITNCASTHKQFPFLFYFSLSFLFFILETFLSDQTTGSIWEACSMSGLWADPGTHQTTHCTHTHTHKSKHLSRQADSSFLLVASCLISCSIKLNQLGQRSMNRN